MNIHYLQHVSFEGPGFINQWAAANQHSLTATRFFEEGFSYPDIQAIDALVVLGGPMSIYDDEQYAWLSSEKAFLDDVINAGKKVLGICLGAQLLANVLGAAIKPAPVKEIGWFPVYPTEDAAKIGWFKDLFADKPEALHWHGDRFEIPFGAISLAATDANTNQAFLVNDQVLALQFHLEATTSSAEELIRNCAAELIPGNFIQDEAALMAATAAYVHRANKLMGALLDHFLI